MLLRYMPLLIGISYLPKLIYKYNLLKYANNVKKFKFI